MNLRYFWRFVVLMVLSGCQGKTEMPTPAGSPNPLPSPHPTVTSTPEATISSGSILLNNADGSLDGLKGIAKFHGTSNCTGVFIHTSEQVEAPAYLITNGHCVQDWHPNNIYSNIPAGAGVTATFNYFIDTQDAQITIPAKTIAYSTMKGRDVAIVELEATIGELTKQGIQPFVIADSAPMPTATISVFGVPVTALPPEEWYLRGEECSMTGQADLLEFQWHFFDAFRNNCRDIFGGSSGSPIFAKGSDTIFGLINTTTVGGEYSCALGVPCEVSDTGIDLHPNTSYATPIIGLSHCFDEQGRFSLSLSDCPLDGGNQLMLDGYPLSASQPIITDDAGLTYRAAWNTTLAGDFAYYRYKAGAVSAVNCRAESGYGDPIALATDSLIEEEIPEAEGFYYLCVVAGNSPTVDSTWQSFANATVVLAHIDTTPPVIAPILSVQDFETEYYLEPIFRVPELVHYVLKLGPPATTDCDDPAGYFPYRRIALSIEKSSELPTKVCVIGYDEANNQTPPLEQIIGDDGTPD